MRSSILSLAAACVMLAWAAAFPGRALAHANIIASSPAADSVLDTPPLVVTAQFTEPMAAGASRIRVLDQTGKQVDRGDSGLAPADPTRMAVSLLSLPNGTYTVAWQTLSTVDGHSLRGSYVFSIGEPLSGGAVVPDAALLQSPMEPVVRWVEVLGLAAGAGGVVFLGAVLLRAPPAGVPAELWSRVLRRSRRLAWVGFLLAAGAAALKMPLYAQLLGLPDWLDSLQTILATNFGGLLALRFGLYSLAAMVLGLSLGARGPLWASRPGFGIWVPLVLSLGAICALAFSSHAAATSPIESEATSADMLHLAAALTWVGGLVHLGAASPLVLREKGMALRVLPTVLPRFSVLAALSVGVLAATGLYAAWAQVTAWRALFTPYGLTLLVKGGLVIIVVTIAAVNLMVLRPRLMEDEKAGRRLRFLVTIEAALAGLVLLATGLLGSLEPGRQVASRAVANEGKTLTFTETLEGTTMALAVSPAKAGRNRIEVTLEDQVGSPIENATRVGVTVSYQGADLGETPQAAAHLGNGRYVIEAVAMPIAGVWQVEVEVQRPDAFDARTAFRFALTAPGAASSAAIAPTAGLGRTLFALVLAAVGVVFVAVSFLLGPLRSHRGRWVAVPGVAAFALAGAFFFLPAPPDSPGGLSNPFPPNAASLAIGKELYSRHCSVCHGEGGRGDGPGAAGLHPPPLDLTIHARLHPQADLHRFIADGVPRTAMPAWRGTLSEEQTWHLVNYVLSLSRGASAAP